MEEAIDVRDTGISTADKSCTYNLLGAGLRPRQRPRP